MEGNKGAPRRSSTTTSRVSSIWRRLFANKDARRRDAFDERRRTVIPEGRTPSYCQRDTTKRIERASKQTVSITKKPKTMVLMKGKGLSRKHSEREFETLL